MAKTASDTACEHHSGIFARIDNLETSDGKQWEAISRLEHRLPVWATLLISLLTFLLGGVFTYAAFAVRLAEIAAKNQIP